ncbi:MAG: zinc transporter ZntB [Spartobacteria bacterium]|nr:zinc transporter ZntB [Spartobacteria bacterium]
MKDTKNDDGLIHAYLLDGKGGGRLLNWEEIDAWESSQGVLWAHLSYAAGRTQAWIRERCGFGSLVSDALLAEETRPRATAVGEGLLIALRGINMNPGATPDDMVSVRLWADHARVVSTCQRDLISVADLVESIDRGNGPVDTADFIVTLSSRMVSRMTDSVDAIEDQMADLEDNVLAESQSSLRLELSTLRRQTIAFRRYLAPEREAISSLMAERVPWMLDTHRMRLREVSDKLMRHIEDIDAVRDRAAVTHEELLSRASEQQNKRMYILSLVAAIFMPLGFLTGLLGINVAGIPGAENPYAFMLFIVFLAVVVTGQLVLFKRKRWF